MAVVARGNSGAAVVATSENALIIKNHHSKAHNASFLVQNFSKFVIAFLKKNKKGEGKNKAQALKNTAHQVLSCLFLHNARREHKRWLRHLLGAGFAFSGRAYGAKKAASFSLFKGSVPFNTLQADIDYASVMQKTRNGTWGFRT